MEYFLIANSTNLKEVGHYIQSKGMPDGYNYKWFEQPNSMTNLTNDAFPDFEPDLVFELEKKAKLTDIISTSNISAKGLLMNEKTKNIFEQCNLGQHKFYPATVIYKNEKYQYFWLHLIYTSIDNIDFKNSVFYEYSYVNGNVKVIKIENTLDYEYKNEKLDDAIDFIKLTTLKFKENSQAQSYDLTILPYMHYDIIVSEKLLIKLKNDSIIGYLFNSLI